MGTAPTIYDVAERAGVSKSLVSLVLRGSAQVSEERREAVLTAVSELNYTPSRLAAGLAGTRTRNIGVVVDDFTNLWFAPALAGIREALQAGGYSISISDTALNAHLDLDPLEVFRSLRVDGVILAGEVSDEAARRLGIPAVVLGTRAVQPDNVPVISSDEVAGGRLAAEHLIGLGHREVTFISAPGATAAARERGYREAMGAAGHPAVVAPGAGTTEIAGREATAVLLERGGRPTGLVTANDRMAVGALGALHRAGLSVPADVSLVGYDNSPLAAYDWVSLTTVDPDSATVGRSAGDALIDLIEGASSDAAMVLLEPRVVVRDSSGPVQ
ncbi:LacI family DNA-binding transcriptional regulator [Leucobacter tardus]|uniref:LacI family DNA-binding transcriptional regulator n=1 Tax=Leucobacter tardus TaxID=501483 RepID=A0A939QE70_9MICO|nr:LacI family DNA-binding transcriptional regulator [Leucobacter tardus]MBO2989523.1 LacI family DNA-binding transcriptional regulator [Leucobacter tardus]